MSYDLAVLEQKIKTERRKLARLAWVGDAFTYMLQSDMLEILYRERRNQIEKKDWNKVAEMEGVK